MGGHDQAGIGSTAEQSVQQNPLEYLYEKFSAYIADRIRQRVKNPVTAEKLIPKDHGFGMQRLPLETNYFEAFNRDNVELVTDAITRVLMPRSCCS